VYYCVDSLAPATFQLTPTTVLGVSISRDKANSNRSRETSHSFRSIDEDLSYYVFVELLHRGNKMVDMPFQVDVVGHCRFYDREEELKFQGKLCQNRKATGLVWYVTYKHSESELHAKNISLSIRLACFVTIDQPKPVIQPGLRGLVYHLYANLDRLRNEAVEDVEGNDNEEVVICDKENNGVRLPSKSLVQTSQVMKAMLQEAQMEERETRIVKAEKFSFKILQMFCKLMSCDQADVIEKTLRSSSFEDLMELFEFIAMYDFEMWKPLIEQVMIENVRQNQEDRSLLVRLINFADMHNLELVFSQCVRLISLAKPVRRQ
jgi:hypothetical protein